MQKRLQKIPGGMATFSYVLFIVILQLAVFNLQFVMDFGEAMIFTLIFFAGFSGSLMSMLWKNLRPKILFTSPVIFLGAGILESLLLNSMDVSEKIRFTGIYEFFDFLEDSQIIKNTVMLVFVSFLVSSGNWINSNYENFSIRRGANDLDEVKKIYFWKEKFIPGEGDNIFKYQKLLGRSFTLVGVIKNDIQTAIHAVRIDDALFYFDFFVSPDWKKTNPDTGKAMVQNLLSRPELHDESINIICALVRSELDDTCEDYYANGFEKIQDNDPVLSEIKSKASLVLSQVYPDWKPLGRADTYLIYKKM